MRQMRQIRKGIFRKRARELMRWLEWKDQGRELDYCL